jgi:hypothetical protein
MALIEFTAVFAAKALGALGVLGGIAGAIRWVVHR